MPYFVVVKRPEAGQVYALTGLCSYKDKKKRNREAFTKKINTIKSTGDSSVNREKLEVSALLTRLESDESESTFMGGELCGPGSGNFRNISANFCNTEPLFVMGGPKGFCLGNNHSSVSHPNR
jgi:hypothetical protein